MDADFRVSHGGFSGRIARQSAALLTMKVVHFVHFRALSGALSFEENSAVSYIIICIYINIYNYSNLKNESTQNAQGGTLGFCAKKYVHLVHFRFSASFLRLFLLNSLLFLVLRRIHVNESAQIRPCPWMCTCDQIHGFIFL